MKTVSRHSDIRCFHCFTVSGYIEAYSDIRPFHCFSMSGCIESEAYGDIRHFHCFAMSSYIQSEAVFQQRFAEIGSSAAYHRILRAANFSTMGKYAYSCNFGFGAYDDPQLIAMDDRVCGADPDDGDVGPFRCLFYQANLIKRSFHEAWVTRLFTFRLEMLLPIIPGFLWSSCSNG